MDRLIHCIYASVAAPDFEEHEIPELLEQSRADNEKADLTGMLLYVDGSFFQVLEGRQAVVDTVYARIIRDDRHSRITLIIREPIARRNFAEWSMGFSTIDRSDAGAAIGENDFFQSASCIERLDASRAKKLLAAFRGGRWRMERTGTFLATGSGS